MEKMKVSADFRGFQTAALRNLSAAFRAYLATTPLKAALGASVFAAGIRFDAYCLADAEISAKIRSPEPPVRALLGLAPIQPEPSAAIQYGR